MGTIAVRFLLKRCNCGNLDLPPQGAFGLLEGLRLFFHGHPLQIHRHNTKEKGKNKGLLVE
jgi:hypothetical protein